MNETREQMAGLLEGLAVYFGRHYKNDVIAALRAGAQALREQNKSCIWTQDKIDGGWDTACGQSWVFENYGPDENHVTFCHGCGGRRVSRLAHQEGT